MTTMAENKITEIEKEGYILIRQSEGPDLGYSPESGVKIIVRDGLAFKSYDGTDTLRPYADWRLDPAEPVADRNYRGKSVTCWNECDLGMVEQTRRLMGDRPVIVVMDMANPTVMSELDPLVDAVLVGFSVQTQAFLDLIFGEREPSGLLPFEMPASMEAIEAHCEDKPHDIAPFVDSDGNVYEFGYGLNYKGRISDERTRKYCGR